MTFKSEHRYFLAIVPPDDISGRITELKHSISENYRSKHALRSPPHITLHMPFKWKSSKQEVLDNTLNQIANSIQPFEIKLVDFGCFAPRVIFVSVENSEALSSCFDKTRKGMRSLNILNASYKERPFHPHATIAFRDLKKEKFIEAWSEFQTRSFEASFIAKSITLLEHHVPEEGSPHWEVKEHYPFST